MKQPQQKVDPQHLLAPIPWYRSRKFSISLYIFGSILSAIILYITFFKNVTNTIYYLYLSVLATGGGTPGMILTFLFNHFDNFNAVVLVTHILIVLLGIYTIVKNKVLPVYFPILVFLYLIISIIYSFVIAAASY